MYHFVPKVLYKTQHLPIMSVFLHSITAVPHQVRLSPPNLVLFAACASHTECVGTQCRGSVESLADRGEK